MIYEKESGVLHKVERVINNGGGVLRRITNKYEKVNGVYRKVFEKWPDPKLTIIYKNYYNPNLTYWKDYGMQNNLRFVVLSDSVKVETYRNTHNWNTAIIVDYLTQMSTYNFACVDLELHTTLRDYSFNIVTSDLISSPQGWAHTNAVTIHSETRSIDSILHIKGMFPLSAEAKTHQAFNLGIQKDRTLGTYMIVKYLYFI